MRLDFFLRAIGNFGNGKLDLAVAVEPT